MSPAGLEETANSRGKTRASAERAAQSGAIPTDSIAADPDLAAIVKAWPALPEAARQAILALVRGPVTD